MGGSSLSGGMAQVLFLSEVLSQKRWSHRFETIALRLTLPPLQGWDIWAFLCTTRQQINTWVSLTAVMFTFTSRYTQICLKTTTKMRLSSFSSPEVILRGEVSVLHAVCVCVCWCICAVLMFLRLPVSICGFVWFIFLPQCPLKTIYRCCNLNWCDIEFKPVRSAYCGTHTHTHKFDAHESFQRLVIKIEECASGKPLVGWWVIYKLNDWVLCVCVQQICTVERKNWKAKKPVISQI